MSSNESIELPSNYEDIKCDQKDYFKNEFVINLKV